MRKNPGRKRRRALVNSTKKNGDLNRLSTHRMRSNIGMATQEE